MQRYFSTFPGSWPGVGLLLLRVVVGGAATIQGAVHLTHMNEPNALMGIAGALAAVAGLAILCIATWAPPNTSALIDRLAVLIVVVDAAALALLGPGALSIDARLFGRREITIPRDPLA